MFADDIALVESMVAKYGPAPHPIVECGGLIRPCVAQYQNTIDAMAKLRWLQTHEPDGRVKYAECVEALSEHDVREAQMCRYLNIERPLSFLGDYVIENPGEGDGLSLERLTEKYDPARGTGIGTAIVLSVLEHVDDPFIAIDCLREAMQPGGLVMVSVPFIFPEHAQCGQDCWRFTPTALKHIFAPSKGGAQPPAWDLLESGWRLRISASAGVLNLQNGEPQAIESCFAVARAI